MEMKFKSSVGRIVGYSLAYGFVALFVVAGLVLFLIKTITGESGTNSSTMILSTGIAALATVAIILFVVLHYNVEVVVNGNGEISFHRMGKQFKVVQAKDVLKAQVVRQTYLFIPVDWRYYLYVSGGKKGVEMIHCYAFRKKNFSDLYSAIQMSAQAAQGAAVPAQPQQ